MIQVARRLFTVAEYDRMAEAGILGEDDRVELIEGEIVVRSPISSRHSGRVNRLTQLFAGSLGTEAIMSVQNPVHLSDISEPEPDLALLRPRADFYAASRPTPGDVLLLIEVADSSDEYDRSVKLPLYAQAAIPEVWLVRLNQDEVLVCRRPSGGSYLDVARLARGQPLSPLSFPQLQLTADDILG